MTTNNDNPWQRRWTMEEITKAFGAQHMAYIEAREVPSAYCESRAAGWWDANEPESFSQYTSLAAIYRAQGR